jgi:hypothetical protein
VKFIPGSQATVIMIVVGVLHVFFHEVVNQNFSNLHPGVYPSGIMSVGREFFLHISQGDQDIGVNGRVTQNIGVMPFKN